MTTFVTHFLFDNAMRKTILLVILNAAFALILKAQPNCTPITTSNCKGVGAGSTIELTSEPVINFTFNSFGDYLRGINLFGQSIIKLTVVENAVPAGDCRWYLTVHMDNNSSPATEWDEVLAYGTGSSTVPPLNILEMRFRNNCNTPISKTNYVSLNSTALNIPIVSSPGVSNTAGACLGDNVNRPGSYITNFGEFSFAVDYRLKPTLNLQPGIYLLNVKFCLTEGN